MKLRGLRYLRLDDHAKQLSQALSIDVEAAAKLVLDKIISSVDLSSTNIWVVQCTHQIKTTVNFCEQNNLSSRTFFSLKDPLCKYIILFGCNYKYLYKDLWPDLKGSETTEGYFNINYSLEQASVLLYHLTEIVKLVRSLITVSNLSSILDSEKEVLRDNLILCLEVMDSLYKIFDKLCSSNYLNNFSVKERELYFTTYKETMTINREISSVLDKNVVDNNNNISSIQNFKL